MKAFSALLDRLSFETSRNGKLRILQDYLGNTPDPDRGYALAAITGDLAFANAKAGVLRGLIAERTDPVLFAMSYDYVGDLSETIALLWPAPDSAHDGPDLRLAAVVQTLADTGRANLPAVLTGLLDRLDENGRWALLKLITGGLRIGVSARLARTALAAHAAVDVDEVEDMWPSLEAPYETLFAWIDGRGPKPAHTSAVVFRPAMLAHAIDEKDFSILDPSDFMAEWKWDGIRIQAGFARENGEAQARLYSRTGEIVGQSFPDLMETLLAYKGGGFVIDGELLIVNDNKVASFATLQQRLNRKKVTAKLASDFPAHIRAYDLLSHDGRDLRERPFEERRRLLEAFVAGADLPCLSISPQVAFATWDALGQARADPLSAGAGQDAQAVEGVMLKRRSAPYVAGRPKGLWYKWKRDPFTVDAVLMYAQRGHGKRSSFYSDYTFGVWRTGQDGAELVPVGKAYFGFTDAELKQIDAFVRENTLNRFGPVREVAASAGKGLVLEIAFEGLQRSPRHKSGLAMRFPRIARIRWDKPASDADRIETLECLLETQR